MLIYTFRYQISTFCFYVSWSSFFFFFLKGNILLQISIIKPPRFYGNRHYKINEINTPAQFNSGEVKLKTFPSFLITKAAKRA